MKTLAATSLLVLAASACASTYGGGAASGPDGPEAVVRRLYELVTFGPGTRPPWGEVRSLFVDEAVVVLRTGLEEMTVFDLDGFVNDFISFIEQANVESTGFTERVLDMRTFVYGDIAQVLVLFDSQIPGSSRDPSLGVDSFELVRLDGDWRIVSIVNERPTDDRPIPMHVFR